MNECFYWNGIEDELNFQDELVLTLKSESMEDEVVYMENPMITKNTSYVVKKATQEDRGIWK